MDPRTGPVTLTISGTSAALLARLAEAMGGDPGAATMRAHGPRACAECEGRRFWYIARTPERDSNGAPTVLRVVRKAFPKLWWEGYFSTFVCRGCGWIAWYAHELGQLEVDLTSGVRVMDGA